MKTLYFDTNLPKILFTKMLKPIWPGVVMSRLSPVKYRTVDDVPLPSDNHVRVKNNLSLICGSDLHLIYGEVQPGIAPAIVPGNKRIYLGHEVCGTVTEIGK